jgi:hypothetical protein
MAAVVVLSAFTSCSSDAVRRRVRQSKVRENVSKEGRCRTQDAGCRTEAARPSKICAEKIRQAVGVSHGTCSKQPLDDGGGLPLFGWRGCARAGPKATVARWPKKDGIRG